MQINKLITKTYRNPIINTKKRKAKFKYLDKNISNNRVNHFHKSDT